MSARAETLSTTPPAAVFAARGRVRILAREEFRRALESRGLFGFAALLTALVLGLSYFGLAQSGEVGFQGFARVTLSLLNLLLFIVPLTALVLGVTSITSDAGLLPLLLAQPVRRRDVLLGKYVGLGGALSAAQAMAFGAGGVVVAMQAGPQQATGFLALAALSIALGWVLLAVAMCIAVLLADRLRAMVAALLAWLLLVVAYDLAVLGATMLFSGLRLQSVLFPALLANPVDLVRALTMLAVGSGALFGPTSAVLMRWLGSTGGLAIGVVTLAIEGLVPLLLALWVFERRDW